MGKTGLQKFTEKAFSETHIPNIAVPEAGARRLAPSERGTVSSVGARRGRPVGRKANQVRIHFLMDEDLKESLDSLKDRLHRGSVKDLLVEAVNDLLEKYGGD